MSDRLYAWAPLTKADDNGDGTCTVYGLLTDSGIDRDLMRMDQAWLDQAVPAWYSEGANIRQMHADGTISAVGAGIELTRADDGGWWLKSLIVDPVAVKKCLSNPPIYKGYSIGVRDYHLTMGKVDAPNGLCDAGYLCEASLVDRPNNPRTLFSLVKMDDSGELVWVGEGGTVLDDEDEDEPDTEPASDGTLPKFVSAAQRKKMADTGEAMPNGDFPIANKGHLKSAIGRLKNYKGDKAAARRFILKRAKALGVKLSLGKADNPDRELVEGLRQVNQMSKLDVLAAEMGLMAVTPEKLNLRKWDEAADIAGAKDAIAAVARLIQSEAGALANGRMEEMCDISTLMDAARSLKWFLCEEEYQATQGPDAAPEDSPVLASTAGLVTADDEPFNITHGTSDAVTPGASLFYADQPDLRKGDDMQPNTPEPRKKKSLQKAEVAAMIDAAVTKANTASQEQVATANAKVAELEEKLAKVLGQPQGGGPVQMRTGSQNATVRATEVQTIQRQRDELLQKADTIGNNDPVLAEGYRDEAEALDRRLARMG